MSAPTRCGFYLLRSHTGESLNWRTRDPYRVHDTLETATAWLETHRPRGRVSVEYVEVGLETTGSGPDLAVVLDLDEVLTWNPPPSDVPTECPDCGLDLEHYGCPNGCPEGAPDDADDGSTGSARVEVWDDLPHRGTRETP